MTIRAVIVGAGGYSGAELVSILLGHPHAEIVGLFASAKREGEGARALSETFGRFRGRLDLPVRATTVEDIAACRPDAVFLATPHEASVDLAPRLLDSGATKVVLDLSAGFRLADASLYPTYYGFEHAHAAWLGRTVYGLVELTRPRLAGASLVAVPGCYPTSAILPLAPLVRAGAIATRADGRVARPVIDATSGVSGAGRGLALRSLFCEVHQQAYGVLTHRHQPEIDAYAGVPTVFTPHLGAYERGILATIHVELAPGWTGARVRECLDAAYGREAFVRLCPAGVWPSVADVRGTNFCDIAVAVDEGWGHAVLCSALDNLVKGASGQAVQCMNARFGLPETDGLLPGGRTPGGGGAS
ncbi:MAG: N-acetyl-gamma-glutamyl-phosphate reductase [Planctomycetota bacterium]|nr:N-acetyl-gamma-glutamyl-phosphate reductase [Planctomycetota bacterium]